MTEGAPGYTIADMPICFWDGDGLLALPRQGGPQNLGEFMDALCFSPCDLNGTSHYYDPDGWLEDEELPYCVTPSDDDDFWLVPPPYSTTSQPINPFHMVFDLTGDRYVSQADEALYLGSCP